MDKSELTEQAIQKALDWASAAEGFVVEQAPELCREILTLGRVTETANLLGSGLLGVALGVVWFRIRKWFKAIPLPERICEGFQPCERIAVLTIIACFSCLGVSMWFGFQFGSVMKVWFAPRLYVLEQLRAML